MAKFNGNILTLSENIAKSFRGLQFLTHTVDAVFNVTVGQLVVVVMVASELRQEYYSNIGDCSTDGPYAVKYTNKRQCATECLRQATCDDFNYKNDISECALFLHKPLFYNSTPGCAGFKASYNLTVLLLVSCDNLESIDSVIFNVFKHVKPKQSPDVL